MPAIVHAEPRICERRLKQYFNSTSDQWVEIVKAAVAARAGCTENDAKAAPGFYAWNAALAQMRHIFVRESWQRDEHKGIEVISNDEFRRMVAVLNADAGTCDIRSMPRNRTPKGPGTQRAVDDQRELFAAHQMGRLEKRPYELWYLCIFDDGADVRAELAKPIEYEGGYIADFAERIFIIRPGEWQQITIDTPAQPKDDLNIEVRRK